MSGGIAFYPWLVDSLAVVEVLVGGFFTVLLVYLWLRTGRGRADRESEIEPPLVDYAGLIQGGSRKIPVFLCLIIIGLVCLAIGYIARVALVGTLNY